MVKLGMMYLMDSLTTDRTTIESALDQTSMSEELESNSTSRKSNESSNMGWHQDKETGENIYQEILEGLWQGKMDRNTEKKNWEKKASI